MGTRKMGYLSLALTIVTFLWVGLVIVDQMQTGPVVTAAQALAYVQNAGVVFYLNYLNAAVITALAVLWFFGLHRRYGADLPKWARVGIGLVPVYGAMNLVVYLSQVTVVPRLADEAVLAWIQIWPDSVMQEGDCIRCSLGCAIIRGCSSGCDSNRTSLQICFVTGVIFCLGTAVRTWSCAQTHLLRRFLS